MNTIQNAIKSLDKKGSFAFSFSTGELNPKTGYMVRLAKEYRAVIKNYKKRNVKAAIEKFAETKADLTEYGLFLVASEEAGNLILNVYELVKSKRSAEVICKRKGEAAYFDNKQGKQILIN